MTVFHVVYDVSDVSIIKWKVVDHTLKEAV